jgi:hypothetical protein
LLAETPDKGIEEVTLARTSGSNDTRNAWNKLDDGFIGKGLESMQ